MLAGKVVMITGAARGIGRATARLLAEEGAAVGVADRSPEVRQAADEILEKGGKAFAARFDVADPADVEKGVAAVRERLGPIDVLVNNAGIVDNIAPIERMTHEAWTREIAVNLTGAFNMVKAVVASMVERRWGRIISISSIAAIGGLHNQSAYAASKAGLIGLTESLTLELARHGITANAILPGLIGTENVRDRMPAEIRDTAVNFVPARRLGEPVEIAQLIAFLASDRAAFINGAAIPIDGGFTLNMLSLGSRKEIASLLNVKK